MAASSQQDNTRRMTYHKKQSIGLGRQSSLDPNNLGGLINKIQRSTSLRRSSTDTWNVYRRNSIMEDTKEMTIQKANFMKGLRNQRKNLISRSPRRQQLYFIYHLILNQSRFVYSECQALAYFLCCRACRSQSSLKNSKSHYKNANLDLQLKKGQEMLSRDLDIVNLLEMIKNYKLIKDVFFTQDDRFLLKL